jgi:hypothetical protein
LRREPAIERAEGESDMESFIMGTIAMGSAIVAVFFLRFWRDTGDRLFAIFAVSFALLGLTRVGLVMAQTDVESHTYWYWCRLAAFVLILFAIVDKNRR